MTPPGAPPLPASRSSQGGEGYEAPKPKSRFAKQSAGVKAIQAALPVSQASASTDRAEITIEGLAATSDQDPYAIAVTSGTGQVPTCARALPDAC